MHTLQNSATYLIVIVFGQVTVCKEKSSLFPVFVNYINMLASPYFAMKVFLSIGGLKDNSDIGIA